MFRIIAILLDGFLLGFFSRPHIIAFLEDRVFEREAENQSHSFTAYLTGEGLIDGGAGAVPGQGPDGLFDRCDPVEISLSIQRVDDEGPDGFPPLLDITYTDEAGARVRRLIENTVVSYSLSVDGQAAISSGEVSVSASAPDQSVGVGAQLNTVTRRAGSGDLFGYLELASFSVSVAPFDIGRMETRGDLRRVFEGASRVSGRVEFRYCDQSLLGPVEACPAMDAFDLPYASLLAFDSEGCDAPRDQPESDELI